MPYSGPNDKKLPKNVQAMSDEKREAWVKTFNGVLEETDDEGQAMAMANAAAKKKETFAEVAEKAKALAIEHGHDLGGACDKCGDLMPAVYTFAGGATSFEELDSYIESQDLAHEMSEVAYQFQSLQQNIFSNEELSAENKAAALERLAREFGSRIRQLPDADKAALDGSKYGRRIGKPQVGRIERAFNEIKGLLGWAQYDEEKDDDEDKSVDLEAVKDMIESGARSGFKVIRTKAGGARWLSFSSNAYEDVEGEIFRTKALEEAVDWHDATNERGPLRLFHIKGADVGDCDFQAVIGRFLFESGTFRTDELGTKALQYYEAHPDEQHGVSIGFLYRPGDELDGIYDWLRIRERSVCPPGTAANPFTAFAIGGKEDMSLDPRKMGYLERIAGKDLAATIVSIAENKSAELDEKIRFKAEGENAPPAGGNGGDAGDQTGQGQQAPQTPQAAPGPVQTPHRQEGDAAGQGNGQEAPAEEAAKELVSAVKAALDEGFKAITDRIDQQDTRLAALEKSDDEKIADRLGARGGPTQRGFQASTSDKTIVTDEAAKAVQAGHKDEEKTEYSAASPVAPYVGDLLRQLGVQQTPAGAASS